MAERKAAKELAKKQEKRKFFASEYGLKQRAGLSKIGDTAFVIPLETDKGFFNVQYHSVKSRRQGTSYKGFKGCGISEQKIACKGEEGLCEELAQQFYDKYPEKENASKRPISFAKTNVYIPVLVLGNTGTDPNKALKGSDASIKSWDFSFLELTQYSYNENFIKKMGSDLQRYGIIDEEAEEEEIEDLVFKNLDKVVIKITLVASQSSSFGCGYQKEYTFIPFEKPLIGKNSGEHDDIIKYTENKDVLNGVQGSIGIHDYMTLFESEVDNFAVSWTEEELKKYLLEDMARDEKVKQCAEEYKEEIEAEDTKYDEEEMSEEELEESLEQVESILTEDDITFDDDDMFDDDEDEDDEE